MKRILIFGDSNTWGYISHTFDPKSFFAKRFMVEATWPGVIATSLGQDYEIIIEGLPGRTISMNDNLQPEVNGKIYFWPCLLSHRPLDMIIIMLGTNDLKIEYGASIKAITSQLGSLCELALGNGIGQNGEDPTILILTPPQLGNLTDPLFSSSYLGLNQSLSGLNKSYSDFALKNGFEFFDTSFIIPGPDTDGIHFDLKDHKQLGEALTKKIRNYYGEE